MQPNQSIIKDNLPVLTGVRAAAAFMVYFYHFNPFNEWWPVPKLSHFVEEWHTGVGVFFVLSGFLITYRYYLQPVLNFKTYWINRCARIYPMYFVLTTVTYFIIFGEAQQNSPVFTEYILNITFLRGFFDDLKFSGIAPGWTLTVEECFYLASPLFFRLIKRHREFLVLLPIALFSIGVGIVQLIEKNALHGFFRSISFMTLYTFFGRASEFFIGITLAIIFRKYGDRLRLRFATLLGAAVMIACLCLLVTWKGGNDSGIRSRPGMVINNFILPLCGVAVFFWGLLTERTWFSRLLSSPLFVLLGKSSYIFYLIHMGIISSFVSTQNDHPIVHFLALNLLAIVLFKAIEEPMNKYIRQYFRDRRQILSVPELH